MKKVIIGARVASSPNDSLERREDWPPLINAATTVSACPVDEKRQKLANYPTAEGEWRVEVRGGGDALGGGETNAIFPGDKQR